MTLSSSSWGKSSQWYGKIVGKEGHYYHQHTVLPVAIHLLNLSTNSVLLDIGCGQGVLSRAITHTIEYWGVDNSKALLKEATKLETKPKHRYICSDATLPLALPKEHFTHAAVILALQNMRTVEPVFTNIAQALKKDGTLVIVLNHPCFRIPRQSGWTIDEQNKQQKRWIARYMTPMEIPIDMHPGKNDTTLTWSFHQPLSYYIQALAAAGFVIETIEEMTSDKESVGKQSKMENRSRNEIPLFLAIKAKKAAV